MMSENITEVTELKTLKEAFETFNGNTTGSSSTSVRQCDKKEKIFSLVSKQIEKWKTTLSPLDVIKWDMNHRIIYFYYGNKNVCHELCYMRMFSMCNTSKNTTFEKLKNINDRDNTGNMGLAILHLFVKREKMVVKELKKVVSKLVKNKMK